MSTRRWLWIVCVVAAIHALFFIWYQQPDWTTEWSDQEGYRRLGFVLAQTGRFTRYPDASRFVPEVIRTPVYPAFVAVVYRLFGTGQLPIAIAQSLVFAGICLLVFDLARRTTSDTTVAIAAAAATALFPPLPYFVPLVMTEVLTTLLFMIGMCLAARAIHARTAWPFALLGLVIALTTLSRPVFVLFPFALAAVGLIVFPLLRVRVRPRAAQWAALVAAFLVAMAPWFIYNYVTLGRFTLSPAGGIGRGLWEGSWQAAWSGRLQNELTHAADETAAPEELDRRIEQIAEREHAAAAPMLEYVHQWRDIRLIWTAPTDPYERALARADADREYQRVALSNIARDSPGHLIKRLARGVFILWAGEIPFRYSDINRLSPAAIYACWAAQAALFAVALGGLVMLAARGRVAEACLLATPIVYITVVHFPLLTEARQSLPAQPVVLLLATIAVACAVGHSLPLEAQVHERQHL
jgi:4-amino-4-deoxy-L-arabinose transferase-like glycosyltransferase